MRLAGKTLNNGNTGRLKLWPRRRRFIENDDGSVTVEFVLWVPIFVLILALTVDASMIFMTQSNMWSVTRDTTRHMATGLYTNAEAEDYAAAEVANWNKKPVVNATRTNKFVTITMDIPISDVAVFNIIGAFSDGSISTRLTQRLEPK